MSSSLFVLKRMAGGGGGNKIHGVEARLFLLVYSHIWHCWCVIWQVNSKDLQVFLWGWILHWVQPRVYSTFTLKLSHQSSIEISKQTTYYWTSSLLQKFQISEFRSLHQYKIAKAVRLIYPQLWKARRYVAFCNMINLNCGLWNSLQRML